MSLTKRTVSGCGISTAGRFFRLAAWAISLSLETTAQSPQSCKSRQERTV